MIQKIKLFKLELHHLLSKIAWYPFDPCIVEKVFFNSKVGNQPVIELRAIPYDSSDFVELPIEILTHYTYLSGRVT
jgi:hypothetical protein